jgi:hypothetical protein
MKDKSELMLRSSLCNAGYSEEAVDKILGMVLSSGRDHALQADENKG